MLILLLLILSSACQKAPTPKPVADEQAFQKPSASEIFTLRSKCAELGQKIMNGNIIGIALAQEQVSHYDPNSNRCYVKLTVHSADLTHIRDTFTTYLYDGQTGQMLGWSEIKKGVKDGFMFSWVDMSLSGPDSFNAANTEIGTRMADDQTR
ncbi:MAG: hypothetical protein ABSC23_12290 [Bryobacteraceae bacterium]